MTATTTSASNARAFFPIPRFALFAKLVPASGLVPLLLAAALLVPSAWNGAELDGHEALVAQTAREMSRRSDWLEPTFAGEVRLAKPPLAYWLAMLSYRMTGSVSPWTARLPMVILSLATVAMVTRAGAKWFGPAAGHWAGVAQATSLWSVHFGSMATVDGALAALVTLTILMASGGLFPNLPSTLRFAFCAAGAAVSALAKGPVGLVFLAAPVLAVALMSRKNTAPRPGPIAWFAGGIVFLAVCLPWPVAILLKRPDAFAYWQDQSLGRFLHHFGPNTRPWSYYLYQAPAWTLPWSAAWLLGLYAAIQTLTRGIADWQKNLGVVFSRTMQNVGRRGLRKGWHWRLASVSVFGSKLQPRADRQGASPSTRLCDSHRTLARRQCHPIAGTDAAPQMNVRDDLSTQEKRGLCLCLAWFFGGLLFLSLSQGKREHYLLPALPALSLIAGWWLSHWVADRPARTKWLVRLTVAWTLAFGSYEAIVRPMVVGRPAAREFLARNQDHFAVADLVIQFGTNDRWSAFLVDRPMTWPITVDQLAESIDRANKPLVIMPRNQLVAARERISFEVVDQVDTARGRGEQSAKLDLVLLRPKKPTGMAR